MSPNDGLSEFGDSANSDVMPKGREAVSLLSHDLRSLLFDVTGGLQLLDRGGLANGDQVQLDRVEHAANALGRMLEHMLDRIDALPAGAGETTRIVLAEFLDSTCARWQGRAEAIGAKFELSAQDDLPPAITLDRIALDRIVGNLISNALKFDADGSVILDVRLDGDDMVFAVSDCGPGFSKAALTTLYEFHGRPTDGCKPGSGLGLHIARRQAGEVGGTLQARNRQNGGAVVEFRLPFAAWNLGDGRPDPTMSEADIPDLAGVRVLLAEDNATNQLVAGQMLRSMGCNVVVVSDGVEAIDVLGQQRFDAVLLDIEMPRMSGLEVLRQVRASDGPNAATPLIALTAYVMREHRERIDRAGAADVVAKPITSVARLGRAIQAHLPNTRDTRAQESDGGKPIAGCMADPEILSKLLSAVGPERQTELLTRLDEDLSAISAGLEQAGQADDLSAWRAQSHILISVAGMTGAGGLQKLAQDLNTAANNSATQNAAELSALCAISIQRLRKSLSTVAND